MPLTQDRMLAVLAEAQQCHDALVIFRTAVEDILRMSPNPPFACAALTLLVRNTPLPPMVACESERRHFASNAHRNVENARKQRSRRIARSTQHGARNIQNEGEGT